MGLCLRKKITRKMCQSSFIFFHLTGLSMRLAVLRHHFNSYFCLIKVAIWTIYLYIDYLAPKLFRLFRTSPIWSHYCHLQPITRDKANKWTPKPNSTLRLREMWTAPVELAAETFSSVSRTAAAVAHLAVLEIGPKRRYPSRLSCGEGVIHPWVTEPRRKHTTYCLKEHITHLHVRMHHKTSIMFMLMCFTEHSLTFVF